jgi:arylsulfatase A-like enzyme
MNVVVVIIDSLRKDHVGAYGNDWIQTPNLDALAKDSMLFTRAYPDSIPTICARRAIHTGTRTWPFRNWTPVKGDTFQPYGWQPVPQDQTMLAEILKTEGLSTNLVTDTHHMFKASYDFQRGFDTFDFIRGQERDHYRPMSLAPQKKVDRNTVSGNDNSMVDKVRQYIANTLNRKSEEDWFAPQVFTWGARYLEAVKETEPFFLIVDSFDVHEPWDPPKKYVDLYDDSYDGPEPIVPNYSDASWISDRELKRMRALYAGEVTMADHWLGTFLDKMESLGLMDNTLLMLLSDHGAALGEHNDTGKPYWALYPELTDITFMIRHPEGKGAGKTSDYYASTHDVAPTILGSMGMERNPQMEGQDLSVILEGKKPTPRPHFTLGYDEYVKTRDDDYAMISLNDGSDAKLFDLKSDPNMDKDIAGKHPDVVKRLWNDYVLKDAGGPLPKY